MRYQRLKIKKNLPKYQNKGTVTESDLKRIADQMKKQGYTFPEPKQTFVKAYVEPETSYTYGPDGNWSYVFDETMTKDDPKNLGSKHEVMEGYRVGYRDRKEGRNTRTDPSYFNIESDPKRIKAITEGKKELGYDWEGEEYDAEADRIGTGRHAYTVGEMLERNINDLRNVWSGGIGGNPPRYEPDSPWSNALETVMQSPGMNMVGSVANIVWSPFDYVGNVFHNLAGDIGGSVSEGIFNTDAEGRLGQNPTYIDQTTGEEKEGWDTDRILKGLYNAATGTYPDRGLEEELYGPDAKLEKTDLWTGDIESRRVPHSKDKGWINPQAVGEPAEENVDEIAHAMSFAIPGAAMHTASRAFIHALKAPLRATQAFAKLPKDMKTVKDLINYAKSKKNFTNAEKESMGDLAKKEILKNAKNFKDAKGDKLEFSHNDEIWSQLGLPPELHTMKGAKFFDFLKAMKFDRYKPSADILKKWKEQSDYISTIRPKAPMSSQHPLVDIARKWGEKDLWGTGWIRNLRNRFKDKPAVGTEYTHGEYNPFLYKQNRIPQSVKHKMGGRVLPKAQWGKIIKFLKNQPKGKAFSKDVLKTLEGFKESLRTDIENISLPGVREAMEQIDRSIAPGSLDYYNQAVEYIKGKTPPVYKIEYKVDPITKEKKRVDLLTDVDPNLPVSAE